ncbi:MAG: YfhO family protein [Clostridia bacterium]|nr:YfhO family protein [Clostridia bacterium]
MMKRLKQNAWLLGPFFLSISVLLAVYAKYGVYPFGSKVAFFGDGTDQLFPFLGALRRTLFTGGNIQYTLNGLFGMDPTALYAYYLASPFNLVVLLFPANNLMQAYLAIILLKVGASAISFTIYARCCLKTGRLIATMFSLGYALMGWMVVHSHFIMWLDALVWLPLVCMGVHRLLQRGRPVMVTLCYVALFWSNYFIGFMVAAFSVLYCAVQIALRADCDDLRTSYARGTMLVVSGLLALGMVAFLIVPTFLITQDSKALIGGTFPRLEFTKAAWEVPLSSLVSLLTAILSGVNTHSADLKLFHGTVPFALAIGFLCSRGIPARKRAVVSGALLLLFYSLQNNWLNLAWHLTNDAAGGYLFRQSFLLSFSFLALGAVTFESLCRGDIHAKQAALRGSLILLFALLLANGLTGKILIPFWQYSVNLALITAGAVLLQMRAGVACKRARHAIALGLLFVMGMDVYQNANQAFFTISFANRARYEDMGRIQETVDFIVHEEPTPYRLGDAAQTASNTSLLYGYPSGTLSSSTANLEALNLANTMGFESLGWPSIRTNYRSNLATDALFGFRYILNGPESNPVYVTEQTAAGGVYQRNPYALPLLFAAPGSFDGIPEVAEFNARDAVWFDFDIDVLNVQQSLLQRVSPQNRCFIRIAPGMFDERRAEYICPADGMVYVYPPWTTARGFTVYWNDEPLTLQSAKQVPIGFAHAGDRIEIVLEEPWAEPDKQGRLSAPSPSSAAAWQVAQIDQQAFSALMTNIQAKTHSVERLTDTRFSAEITFEPGDRLIVTLPHSPGWSLHVDGQPVPLEKALHTFMGAQVEPGKHSLVLTYTQPGRRLGLAISAVCWLAFGLYIAFGIYRHRRRARFIPPHKSRAKLPRLFGFS